MRHGKPNQSISNRPCKVLVIDDDDLAANTVATTVPRGSYEVISCRNMALAEVAMEMVEFDLILVAPSSTGVDGLEGLAVADYLVARNPRALTAVMVPQTDVELSSAAARRGTGAVLNKPLVPAEFTSWLREQAFRRP